MDTLNKINMVTRVYRISILLRPIEKEKIFIKYMDNNNVVPCFKIGKQKIVKNPLVREYSRQRLFSSSIHHWVPPGIEKWN